MGFGAALQPQDFAIATTTQTERSKGSFTTFGLSKNLLRAVSDIGFTEPRPIQAKAIPQILQGRDVLGLAQTGTGKTAAFALPIIERLIAGRGHNPRALILAPTRELAIQIHAEVELLAKYTNVRATTVFGGVGAKPQIRALRSRPDIVVACPGRLLDLMGSGDARMDGIEVLVLDEADHMFDMGFLPDIKRIISRLPKRRQNLLFSATMPNDIRVLTERVLHNPHVVELASSAPLETIEHALYPVDQKRKTALLEHLLAAEDFRSAIVFLRTKHRARRLAKDLDQSGHRAVALQGNMSQSQRQKAMQGFRDGRFDVLVATDIAARGIDVAQVSHVINFDIPNTPEAYTHRIGRTGRSERSGKAYTFVTTDDFSSIKDIERKLKMSIPRVKLKDFRGSGGDWIESRGDYSQRSRGAKASGARPGASARRTRAARTQSNGGAGKPKREGAAEKPFQGGPGFGAGLDGGASGSQGGPRKANSQGSKNARKRKRIKESGSSKSRGFSGPPSFGSGVSGSPRPRRGGGTSGRR